MLRRALNTAARMLGMDGEDAMKNVTRKEKKIKSKSSKGEKSEECSRGRTQESQNISDVDATEQVRASGNDGFAERKNDLKKKSMKSNEAEYHFKKGSEEGELNVSYGEDRSGDPMVDAERKMKIRDKDKTTQYTKEVEDNEKKNGEIISKTKNTKERKKKHKAKRKLENVVFEKVEEIHGKEAGQHMQNCERKKRKMEKFNSKDDSSLLQQEKMLEYNVVGNIGLTEHDGNDGKELERKKKKKKKHTQLIESGSDDLLDNGVGCDKKGKIKKTKPVKNGSDDASPNKRNKKVRFSFEDVVFPIPDNLNLEKENVGGDGLIRGKRFSLDEDETVKAAVMHYIEKHNLGDEGLDMVLNCMKNPKVNRCWKEIGTAIPYRPYRAIYFRAQCLFHRPEVRKWTQEEYDLLRSYQTEHGNKWKAIATELGKYSNSVGVTWYRIKGNYNRSHWSQDEYQKLFNLVNLDLQAKLSKKKISKHGMFRDNICWTEISDALSTRSNTRCCDKWYLQLTSRMVADGVWADKDDYRLIEALYGLDATCVEDVDWDVLLDNRERDLCRKRWNQMVLHIGQHGNKSFSEQVEVLAQRYCPILLEAREAWDSKPRVG